jgi:hypothetical protein
MTFSTTAEFITPSWLKQMQQIGRLLSGTISSKECLLESFLARQVPSRVEVGPHLLANLRPEGKAARPTQISARPKMIVFWPFLLEEGFEIVSDTPTSRRFCRSHNSDGDA